MQAVHLISVRGGGQDRHLRVPTLIGAEAPLLRRIEFLADDSALALDFSNQEVDAPEPEPWNICKDNTRRYILMSASTGGLLYTSHIMDHRRLTARRGFTVLPGPFHPAPLHSVIPLGVPHFPSARPLPQTREAEQRPSMLATVSDGAALMESNPPVTAALQGKNVDQDAVGSVQTGQKPNPAPGTPSLHAMGAGQTHADSWAPTAGLLLHHEATVVHLSAVHLAFYSARCQSDQPHGPGHSAASSAKMKAAEEAAENPAVAAASSAALPHSDVAPGATHLPSDSTAACGLAVVPAALEISSQADPTCLPQRSATQVPVINPNDPHAVLDATTPVLDLRQQGQLFPPGGPHCHISYGQHNLERYYPDFRYPPGGPTSSVLVPDQGCGGVNVQAHSHLVPQSARPATPSAADVAAQNASGRWFSPSGTLLIRLEKFGDEARNDCVLLHTTVGHGCGTKVALHIDGQRRRSLTMLAQVARLEWVPNSREAMYGFVCCSPVIYLMDAIHHQVSLILVVQWLRILMLFLTICYF